MADIKVNCIVKKHEEQLGCYNCCERCNYEQHICPCCGDTLSHDGRSTSDGTYHLYEVFAELLVVDDRGRVVEIKKELSNGNSSGTT